MSGKELFEGMSYVDERYVDEAEQKTIAKRVTSPWIKIVSMAACLCLVLFSMYKLISHRCHVENFAALKSNEPVRTAMQPTAIMMNPIQTASQSSLFQSFDIVDFINFLFL